jgi:isocitrate/isopropylmalate dehydrogenase
MLTWLGQKKAADQLLEIVETVCEKGIMTPDLGGTVCAEIQAKLCTK